MTDLPLIFSSASALALQAGIVRSAAPGSSEVASMVPSSAP